MASNRLPKVLIIYTGGTFGMTASAVLSPAKLSPATLKKRLKERVPELRQLAHCDIEILLNRDSAHIGPHEWLMMAQFIESRWSKYDGIVLLHGTDTLAFTASALSFLLRPCLRPVVITGAQRPLAALRSDARRNLISAVEIAAHGPRELVNQVTAFFDNQLLQGNRARKRSATEFAAFESPRTSPLALVGTTIRYVNRPSFKRSRVALTPAFSDRIAMLYVTPGFPAEVVTDHLLSSVDGLVLVVFPSGTAPTHEPQFISMLREARKRQIPVVIATEGEGYAPEGTPTVYEAGQALIQEGCYWAGEMTTECAYVKTALLLAQPNASRSFKKLWSADLAGEGAPSY